LKTLKISAVATVAWWLRLPHRVWAEHPALADFLMALVLCILLQILWSEPKRS
jgi:hypothetical protein